MDQVAPPNSAMPSTIGVIKRWPKLLKILNQLFPFNTQLHKSPVKIASIQIPLSKAKMRSRLSLPRASPHIPISVDSLKK